MGLKSLSLVLAALTLTILTSCVKAYTESVGGEPAQVFSRTYLTDFNTAWQSILEALKNSQIDIANQEGGYVQTKWTENTAEKNFTDSFNGTDAYLKAQYRFRVSVSKGIYRGRNTVKIRVQKEQLIQKDVLEGWKPIESDTIDEATLLYRIGRVIYIKMKIARLEDRKAKKEIESVHF